jgi:energy-coupling factor transporter ATP-binding protein EcfA2
MTASTTASTAKPLIAVHNLHYAYPGMQTEGEPQWVLRGVELEVYSGEVMAVMGATGAGKSTLALAMLGIVPQSTGGKIHGTVRIGTIDPRKTPVSEVARRVGLVFQDPEAQFLTSSLEDEVAFGMESLGVPPAEMEARLSRALADVGLTGYESRSPYQLSGGEKQRAAIAAILAMRPEVLILDEPTASLDPGGAAAFAEVVNGLRASGQATILLFSNDSDWVLATADRVALLGDGSIRQVGPPAMVLGDVDLMHDMGLAAPQLFELSEALCDRCNLDERFADTTSARRALIGRLEGRGLGQS